MSQTYRLASVLEVRRRLEREAARTVASRRMQVLEAEAELVRRAEAIAACIARIAVTREQMFEQARDGSEAYRLVEFRTHLSDLKRIEGELVAAHQQQRGALSRAESELDKAIAALNEARKQSKILEKHRESWKASVDHERQQREQKVNEEIGMVLYERHRRHAS
jgi:flagellar biosynthesis chaperone FliJ